MRRRAINTSPNEALRRQFPAAAVPNSQRRATARSLAARATTRSTTAPFVDARPLVHAAHVQSTPSNRNAALRPSPTVPSPAVVHLAHGP
uniref:Uncharacterized protein n=1 Tax=Plectus sambesii TaxID=2011161 RepID=A0A914XGT4_9BILA